MLTKEHYHMTSISGHSLGKQDMLMWRRVQASRCQSLTTHDPVHARHSTRMVGTDENLQVHWIEEQHEVLPYEHKEDALRNHFSQQ